MNDSSTLSDGSGEVCPPEDIFVQMLQGELHPDARQRLDAHLDRCPMCARLVLELADLISHYSAERPITTPSSPDSEDEEHARAPILLDGYRLEEMIGAGGMGVVYRARDLTLDRDVAIKVIRADLLVDAQSPSTTQPGKRLLQEARMLARVEHPNVVSIYAASFAGEHLYIVMELVEGETLDTYIREHSPSPGEILDLYSQVCQGLEAAHARGVIHRDVKPSNILVNTSGDVLLTDFGLARAVLEQGRASHEGAGAQSSLTRRGVVLGTPAFMPPEQHLGGVADERSDVFACCASIFWSIFGVRPFEGDTIEEVALNACAGEVRDVSLDTPAMRALHATLIEGMARKKEARHASITDLARALRAARALFDSSSAAPTRPRTFGRALLLATAALFVVGAGVALWWYDASSSTTSPRQTIAPIAPRPVEQERVTRVRDDAVEILGAVVAATNALEEARDRARLAQLDTAAQEKRVEAASQERSPRKESRQDGASQQRTDRLVARTSEPAALAEQAAAGQRIIEAQAKVNRALQRLDARACHAALKDVPAEDTSVQLFRGQCLLLDGECEASDALFRNAYSKISPGMDISGLLDVNRALCKPPAEEPEALLAWRSGVLFYRDVPLCIKVARQLVATLDGGALDARFEANERARFTLRNNLGHGLRCLARAKEPASLCELVEKMAYHEAKLTGHDAQEVAMRVAMDTIREVPELTVCVE